MEEEKVTLQDQLIDLLTKNNTKLIQYMLNQIEMKYDIANSDISEQEIDDAIQEDKSWTEEE